MLRGRRLIILTRGGQRLGKNYCDDNDGGGVFWPYVTPVRAQVLPKNGPKDSPSSLMIKVVKISTF